MKPDIIILVSGGGGVLHGSCVVLGEEVDVVQSMFASTTAGVNMSHMHEHVAHSNHRVGSVQRE